MTDPCFRPRAAIRFALVALATLGASSPCLALTTFRVEGRMIWDSGPDFHIGDAFTATYSFDPATPPSPGVPGFDVLYENAIKDWQFTFATGYAFAASSPQYSWIGLANNAVLSGGHDLYLAHLELPKSIGAPLPSGRDVAYIQFYFDDVDPAGNPDLLSDIVLSTAPPSLERTTYPFGRLVMSAELDDFGQPQFQITSIVSVPEPSMAGGLILAMGMMHLRFRPRQRHGGRRGL